MTSRQAPLQVLLIEDSPEDVELIERELRRAGHPFVSRCVSTELEVETALVTRAPDLVISDYSMPGYSGTGALGAVRARYPEVPFIFVSGTIGEERAIDALRNGATDYVLKDRLSRLPSAIHRALAETRERRERRALEAQLIEAQKMEAVGRLASGVAHDFNNLLSVILANVDLATQAIAQAAAPDAELTEIREAAQRAASLTRRLLTLARRQPAEVAVFDLNRLVLDLEHMLHSLAGEDATIELALAPDPIPVRADPGQIEQIILNLVINARDALGTAGWVRVATGSRVPHPDSALSPGAHAVLTVRDNGSGMPPEILERLFEPFFTTKPSGKGTGLGLCTSQAIARESGGTILVESSPGEGTAFELLLPRVDGPVDAAPVEGPLALPRGSESLLLVEDDPRLSAVETRVLTMLGYRVVRYARGEDALDLLAQGHVPDLLITDVVLPGMGGVEVALEARSRRPGLKVLFVSGYTAHPRLDELVRTEEVTFLPKPFLLGDLAVAVRRALDRR